LFPEPDVIRMAALANGRVGGRIPDQITDAQAGQNKQTGQDEYQDEKRFSVSSQLHFIV
jgi:hypothetical protein